MKPFRWTMVGAWLAGAGAMGAVPCRGQSVIPNTPAPARDSAARRSVDTAVVPKPSAPKRIAPADTVLAAACAGVGRGGVAQDLLIVVFSAEARAEERAAAIKGVGGVLMARPDAAGDEVYVQFRAAANGESLQSFADRLIRLRQVRSVSLAPCPSPAPAAPPAAPPSPPGDTGPSKASSAAAPPNSPPPR